MLDFQLTSLGNTTHIPLIFNCFIFHTLDSILAVYDQITLKSGKITV